MKDEKDHSTEDAFITFEELERQTMVANALAFGSHYQAVRPSVIYEVSGRRYKGSKTPTIFRDLWASPKEVVAWMEERYGKYDIDAAASIDNRVCEKFYSKHTNCLIRWWGKGKHVWLNPPYSDPSPFVTKAIEQMEHGNQIDMLLPADTSTAWFCDAQKNAAEVIFIVADVDDESCRSGRLSFTSGETGKPVDGNNKGSVIFIMRELKEGEQQKTHYISIAEICPSVKNKRARKR